MLVILNFVYSKKYLKEIIAGYSQPAAADTKATKQDIFGGSKQIKPSSRCVLEEQSSLKIFKEVLFGVILAARNSQSGGSPISSVSAERRNAGSQGSSAGQGAHNSMKMMGSRQNQQAEINQGFTTYADFRDINEEVIYLFCSYSMSLNFTVDQLCQYVLPIGQEILTHCIFSIKKSQEGTAPPNSTANKDSVSQLGVDQFVEQSNQTSITTICSISSINAALESIVIILKNPERNIMIMKKFDIAGLLNSIIQIIKIFEIKAAQDMGVKEQFESKIKVLSLNIELITKLLFFSPQLLMPSSLQLIHNMLDYHRYKKTGIFAVYCVALMIQEHQEPCHKNLMPVFNDERIMKALFAAIREVDSKYKELNQLKLKNNGAAGMARD
jgi:hypothetical protein